MERDTVVTVVIPSVGEAPVGHVLAHKDLIDEQLWTRLVNRIVKDDLEGDESQRVLAERIMDQAPGLPAALRTRPEGSLRPVAAGGHRLAHLHPVHA